jgi:Holliday junction DNA helicase RuvA
MITVLTGRVHGKTDTTCVIDVAGVGYEVAMSSHSLASLPAEGDTVTVLTHLQMRDDGLHLYGFESQDEKSLFEMLISISGVGPKVALSALSALTPSALREAIVREDVALLSATPGIGKKTAQRIIIELKDRIGLPDMASASGTTPGSYAEAQAALAGMGFSRAEVASALADHGDAAATAEDLLRHALKRLGGGK